MHGDTVTIRTDAGVQRLPREELLLILEGSGRELDYWSAKISAGLVARSGNTNQFDLNSTLRVRRLTPGSRGTLNYAGNYGNVEDVETINNHNLTAGLDILITGGFFVNPVTINMFRDPFQNIDLKSTIAAGVGYVILRDGSVDWTVGLSGGYQNTGHVSVEPGEDSRVENGTIIGYTEVEWDITGDIECLFDYNAQVGIPDTSQAFHHARASLSFDILGDILELDLAVIWDRIESPQRDAEGNLPERDDFRSTFGVGLDF